MLRFLFSLSKTIGRNFADHTRAAFNTAVQNRCRLAHTQQEGPEDVGPWFRSSATTFGSWNEITIVTVVQTVSLTVTLRFADRFRHLSDRDFTRVGTTRTGTWLSGKAAVAGSCHASITCKTQRAEILPARLSCRRSANQQQGLRRYGHLLLRFLGFACGR